MEAFNWYLLTIINCIKIKINEQFYKVWDNPKQNDINLNCFFINLNIYYLGEN